MIARAATEVAGEHLADLRVARRGMLPEIGIGGEQDARGAETALQRVLVPDACWIG